MSPIKRFDRKFVTALIYLVFFFSPLFLFQFVKWVFLFLSKGSVLQEDNLSNVNCLYVYDEIS